MMSHQIWHAFYFQGFAPSAPPTRSEVIKAENEEAAAEVARARLGDCKRVNLETPGWVARKSRIILADDGEAYGLYVH
jgi:hypothetical protein